MLLCSPRLTCVSTGSLKRVHSSFSFSALADYLASPNSRCNTLPPKRPSQTSQGPDGEFVAVALVDRKGLRDVTVRRIADIVPIFRLEGVLPRTTAPAGRCRPRLPERAQLRDDVSKGAWHFAGALHGGTTCRTALRFQGSVAILTAPGQSRRKP